MASDGSKLGDIFMIWWGTVSMHRNISMTERGRKSLEKRPGIFRPIDRGITGSINCMNMLYA